MNALQLIVLVVWTLIFVRLVCARATLSSGTFLRWLAIGALLGPLSIGLATNIVNPYGWVSSTHTISPDGIAGINRLKAAAAIGALLLPLLTAVFARRMHRAISLADSFLLGFVVGFGCDLLALAAYTMTPDQSALPFSTIPPAQLVTDASTIVGYGYWCGLVTLAVAAADRFAHKLGLTIAVGALVAIWVIFEHASSITPAGTALADLFTKLDSAGHGTAWLAVVAVILLSWAESRWTRRDANAGAADAGVIKQWQAMGQALLAGHLYEALRQSELFRTRRQLEIIKAEQASGAPLPRSANRTESALAMLESRPAAAMPAGDQMLERLKTYAQEHWQEIAGWTLLALFWFVVPHLWQGQWFWNIPMISGAGGADPEGWSLSLLDVALIGVLLWRYAASTASGGGGATDAALRTAGDRLLLQTGLGISLLCLFFTKIAFIFRGQTAADMVPGAFFPAASVLAPLLSGYGIALPAFTRLQWVTILLVGAVAATGLALALNREWLAMPADQRRNVLIRNVVTMGGSALILIIGVALYTRVFNVIQHIWFPVENASLNFTVLSLYAIAATIIVGAVSFAMVLGLRWLLKRMQATPATRSAS